jgi:hypothetical protein
VFCFIALFSSLVRFFFLFAGLLLSPVALFCLAANIYYLIFAGFNSVPAAGVWFSCLQYRPSLIRGLNADDATTILASSLS